MARWLFQADNRRLKTTHLCRYSAFAAFSFWITLGTLSSNSSNFVHIRRGCSKHDRIQRKTRCHPQEQLTSLVSSIDGYPDKCQ
jgi:hypothetical protein